jgi:hypothetical protein
MLDVLRVAYSAVHIHIITDAGTGYAMAQLVEALRYKPEGREFDSTVSLEFFIDLILPAALWSWG